MEKTIKYLENGEYHYATVKDVGDLAKLKTDSKDDLVAAINDLFENGGENAGKPEGYDNLVNNVADAIQKQQQMSSTITNMQQTAQLSDAEMAHMKQVQEELRQEYLKAIKELNEAVEKAKADAAALDKKTNDMQDKIDETFADVNKEVSDVHKQLDAEAKGLHKDLDETKTNLETTRKDLLNSTQEYGQVHSEVKELQDKFNRRVWSTDLDPVREQVSKNSTEVQQTKDELKNKADQSNLDLVTNSVENLSAQVKQNASGLEVAVKRDELGGDVARLLGDKTNLLLGTRSFSGEDNWKNRDTVTIEPGYYKGLKSAAVQVLDGSIYQPYRVKADTAYTFSFFARENKDNPKAKLAIKPIDAKNINIDNEEQVVHITTEWQRFAVTFSVDKECDISIQVIQGPETTNNVLHLAGLKLQYGQNDTPWEPNEADVAENIEHTESQFNVYSDQIAGIVKKQEKMGDTERQLDTRITETAKGLEQTSKDIQVADGKINEFNGKLESTAQGLKTEYEKYTNDAIGQISDSSLNLIHNSAFSNQDNQFESWQNISAKATVREDSNNLHWVELTQSGQGTDNPQGITSNYFIVKQGKVTVAVDIKLGDKANLDNQNILLLELYDESKKRVDFTDVSVSQLGLSMSILNDRNVHRGLYRLGIDRKDVKYMTVKAILHRNGDLWLTNFSARLSSIDDGGYTPNPDDVNHQILKMNTKIEEDAEHIALKANSVDVTRDIKSAVDGIDISGVNLLRNTDPKQIDEVESDSTWILGSFGNGSAKVIDLPNSNIFTAKHGFEIYGNTNGNKDFTQRPIHWTNNKYVFSVYARIADVSSAKSVDMMTRAWSNQTNRAVFENHYTLTSKQWTRVTMSIDASSFYDQTGVSLAFGLSGYGSIDFAQPMLELANKASKWSPNPQDTSAEIKSAKDAAIQVASDQINLHVNELSTSFDDKLNKRINEQKTAYEKITSDGIEQTVKKITDVKNDVDRLGDTVNSFGGGINLVKETSELEVSGKSYDIKDYNFAEPLEPNTKYTISVEAKVDQTALNHKQFVFIDPYTNGWSWGVQMTCAPANLNYQHYRYTFTTPDASKKVTNISVYLAHPDGANGGDKDNISGIGYFRKLKVEKGEVATPWTPYSQDINKKIDTQTLDSANIDDLKTQGHYFVHNLAGNPISGWVYVDVTGNNNDRVRQDVYADQNNQHKYRSWNGSRWSDWEQGAYLSDVKTEVTASVKNLGDRVTTEVNSVETRVNNKIDGIQVGGRNILSNTENLVYKAKVTNSTNNPNSGDSMWKLAVGNLSDWLRNNPDVKEIAISYDYELQGATPTGTIRFGVNQAPAWEYMSGFNLQGKPAKGRVKLIVPVTDDMRETASNISRIRGDGLPIGATLIISHPKWEVGNKATDWSPAPEDTVEAIKELNTKWDVANGQIQGKVTSTEVQDLLNRGHYATQEWSQGQIKLTKDQFNVDIKKVTNDLNSRVNEAKTASEKFTSDGIEQTVKKVTDVQNNVNNLNKKVDSNNGGGINLQKGTKDCSFQIGTNGSPSSIETYNSDTKMIHTQNGGFYTSYSDSSFVPTPGEFYTISADVKGDGAINGSGFRYEGGNNGTMGNVTLSDTWQRIINTVLVDRVQGQWVIYPSNSKNLYVKHIKIERGTIATPWTPAPEDIEQTIKDATEYKTVTGTIDFNNLKTQQKIFYKDTQATNAPAGGNYWYYLDVEPGYDGRILQTAISDRDNITWIRTFAVNWSPWIRQADKRNVDYLNDQINSFKNETTASVKNLGDRVTTEVNSITSQMNNKINEINTKLDVANGKIEGKVTETQVNNILNGKGYATQSWAQTMFTMKSDAITLQAVRDNITNGIQNQVNSIQGKLEGDLSNICRNPTFSHGVEGWNSSHLAVEGPWSEMPTPKNGTLFVRDAYYGDYFPVSKGERYYTSVFAHNGDSATFVLGLCFQLKDGSLSWLSGSNVPGLQTGKFDGYVDVPDNAVSAKIWVSIQKFDNFGWVRFTNVVVKKNDAISQINITPDQVKIASNKIEIDGNTSIHGDLNVQTVKLKGNNGTIDLTGDGIHIEGPDGDIKLDSGGIDITKSGQGLSITGDYIQVVTDSNGQKEVTGLIGSNFNLKNNNQNGLALLVTPQQDLGRPYGGDILTIGTLQKNGEVMSAVTFDATNITGDGTGFHWTAPHYLHGPAQAIHITETQDNLTLLPLKMPHSSQENYYQPALTVTHGVDGNGNYVHGDSGVEFLWNSIKPYGSVDMTDARLWVYGVDHGIKNVWVSWSNWDGGERYPALVNDIGYWGGIAFPKSGRVTLFDADGRYYCPDRNTGIGAYNNYIGKNNNWH